MLLATALCCSLCVKHHRAVSAGDASGFSFGRDHDSNVHRVVSFHVSKGRDAFFAGASQTLPMSSGVRLLETTLGLSIKGSSSDSLIIGGGLIPLGGMIATPLGLR